MTAAWRGQWRRQDGARGRRRVESREHWPRNVRASALIECWWEPGGERSRAMIVGADAARFEVAEGWEQIPAGWSHPDAVGVAVDAQDRVYVLNRGQAPMSADHPVIVYERDGRFVRSFG